MEKSSVPRNMHFTMTDGSKWVVPTIVIAKHHAKHHAQTQLQHIRLAEGLYNTVILGKP